MPKLNFQGSTAELSGLTPEAIGAAPITAVTALTQRVTDLDTRLVTTNAALAQRLADLETRLAALDQEVDGIFNRSFDLVIVPSTTTP